MRKKLLVLGGGGYYGLINATFLSYLNKDILPDIDSISGCSIGGIIAAALMGGASATQIRDAFINQGAQIFKRRNKNILDIPWYSDEGLGKALDGFVGEKTVGDTDKRVSMFIPAWNLSQNKAKVYDNITGEDDAKKLKDIALETAAAMFYFPIRNVNNDAISDYGIREVVPVITHALGLKDKFKVSYRDMDVFVICAGNSINKKLGNYEEVNNFTAIDWLTKFIINDITASNESTSKYFGEHLGFHSFEWFNPVQVYGSMDDVTEVSYILEECEMYKELFIEKWNKFINS